MLTLNLETFKLFQGSLPLHWLHIWSLCSNLWLCFVDSLSYIFHLIFSVSSCWTLSTGRSLVTTIFGDRRSSQNLDLLKSWIFSQMENGFFQSMDADPPATDVIAQDTKSPDVLTPDMVVGLPALMKLNIEPTTFQDLKEAPGVPPTKRSSLCRIYSDFISEINSDQSKVNRPNQSRKKSLLF